MPRQGSFAKLFVVIAGALLLAGLVGPASAAAQAGGEPDYSCSASALRVTLLGGLVVQPIEANGDGSPCVDVSTGLPFVAVPNPILPVVTASALFARTDILCAGDSPDPTAPPVAGRPDTDNDFCDASPTIAQQVVSRGGVADATINLGGLVIRVRAVESNARAFCDPATNRPAFSSNSRVVDLTINGTTIDIPQNGDPFTLDIGLVRLALNERVGSDGVQPAGQTSGRLIRRAVHVSALSNGGVADVVLGESKVDYSGDICPEGTIIVKKETLPDENPSLTEFGFVKAGNGLAPVPFKLRDDGVETFTDVAPGRYTVTEDAQNPNSYRLDDIECVDPTGNTITSVATRTAEIEVARGETVTCTFTNNKSPNGTVIIREQTTPDEDPNATDFTFTTAGLSPAAFTLKDDGERVFREVVPGQYSVTQNVPPAPYTLSVLDCADLTNNSSTSLADRRATIDVSTGETIVCTFVDLRPSPGNVTCPAGTVPDANGQCVTQNTQCPPGNVKNPQGQCVAQSTECPAGTARNPQGQCVNTSAVCPPGLTLLPGVSTCQLAPTGGRIVPLNQAPAGPCRDFPLGAQFAILGTNGADRITGSNLSDRIFSFAGNDRVSGGRGDDCIQGGGGRDVLDGSNGNDFLLGESGNDQLSGGPGTDRLVGGSGNDALNGSRGHDDLRGGAGRDKLRGEDGNDVLVSGAGNDTIHTGNGRDRVSAGPGDDIINAATRGPASIVDCGPGVDRVRINNNERNTIRNCEFVDTFKRIKRPR